MLSGFQNSSVLVTGNSGFKGSWLSAWLLQLGAKVVGLSSSVPTAPSHFLAGGFSGRVDQEWGDVRSPQVCESAIKKHRPDFVFHLAAQPLVRRSYIDPHETFATNTGGTLNMLEALRLSGVRRSSLPAISAMTTLSNFGAIVKMTVSGVKIPTVVQKVPRSS